MWQPDCGGISASSGSVLCRKYEVPMERFSGFAREGDWKEIKNQSLLKTE
jgi:hypothetical protein